MPILRKRAAKVVRLLRFDASAFVSASSNSSPVSRHSVSSTSAAHQSSARRRFSIRRVALERRLSGIIRCRVLHEANGSQNSSQFRENDSIEKRFSSRFIEPMLLLRTDSLPDSEQWLYELKLDGYRAIAFKREGGPPPPTRNDNDFSGRYPGVVKGLAKMPDDTVIDGEVIAFDDDGPSLVQRSPELWFSASSGHLLRVRRDGARRPRRDARATRKRRELLEQKVLPKLSEPVRYASSLDAALPCSCNR